MEERLKRVESAVFGNGGDDSIKERLARIETKLDATSTSKNRWIDAGFRIVTTVAIALLLVHAGITHY